MHPTIQQVRTFIRECVIPRESEWQQLPYARLMEALHALREEVKSRGLWNPQLEEDWGGMGLSLEDFGRISEELGRSPYGHFLFNCQAPDAGNMEILIDHGTVYQQETWLWPLLRGEIRSCFAMTEPGQAGSNPVILHTTAVLEGDEYVLNGHKWFTTAADGAAFAIVMAITEPEAENPYRRASQLIVPTDTPGFHHVRRIPVMGEAGEGYFSHSEVRLEQCRVPARNLLGKAGDGFVIAQERLGPGRIHHCMRWIGICERAFDMMCQRAAARELKPGVTLAHQQSIQHWIAESKAHIHASRLMVLDAARKIDEVGAYAARTEISMIKFYVAGVLHQILDRAIQVHGALGITDDILLSHWYRHERGARIYDGADEVHKNRVAKEVMKGYGLKL